MSNIFIFHGTEGYPEENWFPWMKQELESRGHRVFVPQFPSPPIVPAKIDEWFAVLKKYEQFITPDCMIIGHSLGGVFTLRVLEKLEHPIRAAVFVGTPVGVQPILNYERDNSFSGFVFNWDKIKNQAKHFLVYQSDNDPYVAQVNGEHLAKQLGVTITLVPHAGHFNTKARYTEFPQLLESLEPLIKIS